ncbi:acetylserotonin O-methyltransferase [Sigmodon hispidus]
MAAPGDVETLMELAHGFMRSQVLFAACDLGVFDVLAEGPRDAESVARVLGSSLHGTRLLLDACVSLGLLLRVEGGGGSGSYANTELSRSLLVSSSPRTQRSLVLYLGGTTYGCWGRLGAAVREGRSQYPQIPGPRTEEPFAAIYRSDAERLLFMRALQETWSLCGRRVLTTFDLSPYREICDLGGGSGALAAECARLYPGSSVTVFDREDVVEAAQRHFLSAGEAGVRFMAGDFFRSRLPPSDLFLLARVLHDWTDAECERLLRRVHGACRPGGAVLIVDAVMAEDGRGPAHALLLSLNMLLQTRGRERSEPEVAAMTRRAGFATLERRAGAAGCDVMLARK